MLLLEGKWEEILTAPADSLEEDTKNPEKSSKINGFAISSYTEHNTHKNT